MQPSNLIALESVSEAWPVGEIVVMDGFVAAVELDATHPGLVLKVRELCT